VSNWKIQYEAERLLLVCDGWELAFLERATKTFGLSFPLDDEDCREAERMLLRALVEEA
jgi:hypothetical protein